MAGCGRSMLVAGGSGFIGSNICKEAIRVGFRVASVSKDGRPSHLKERWADEVDWIQADLRDENAFVTKVREADAIISCVGRFGVGNNNFVEEVNGDLNIGLAHLVHREAGNLSKFGYISAQQYSARFQKPLRSYYNSKLKTETIIQSLFPKNYLILRPNWVFGWRHIFGPIWFPTQLLGAPLEHVMQPIADYCAHTKWVVPPMPVDELAHVMVLGCTVGRDVSGILPTVRVRDVMEREAKGQPLNDWLRGELLQRMKDKKEYFEETSFVEKYGVLGYGKKHTEIALMRHREELNPAMTRPEFNHPVKSHQYLMDAYLTPQYRKLMLVEREQTYLEGRKKQLLFETRKKQEALDGAQRLLGERIDNVPLSIEGMQEPEPATPREMPKLEATATKNLTPGEFEWLQKTTKRRAPLAGSSLS